MRENLLLDLMEFKDWDLTKQFAVARSKVEQIYGLSCQICSLQGGKDQILGPLTKSTLKILP